MRATSSNAGSLSFVLAAAGALALGSCGGTSSSEGSGSGSSMNLSFVSNGFGQLLPHTVFALDANDNPTSTIVELRTVDQFVQHVREDNPIRSLPLFPTGAVLPNGAPGNHFLVARFSQPLLVESVLDPSAGGQANSGLTGAVTVVAYDPATGMAEPVRGRAFIGGQTFAGLPTGVPPQLPLQRWVEADSNGDLVALDVDGDTPGLGFPGTEGVAFAGDEDLASANSLVFVVDTDGNLTTHETFPSGRQIRMRITTSVLSAGNRPLRDGALASTVVGSDTIAPEVVVSPPPTNVPAITPGNGDSDVDPATTIRVEFSEPVQLRTIGSLPDGSAPNLSASILVEFGPPTATTQIPFAVRPMSPYDLTTLELLPAFSFPGEGPVGAACGLFNQVRVTVNTTQFMDLAGNMNVSSAVTNFTTGEGPGVVNGPVAPEAIYVARAGAVPGVSIVDLNGFGQTTGDPTFTASSPVIIEGESKYPFNPNVRLQGALIRPALSVGSCTFNGGSAGVFTLTKDSSLEDKLLRPPLITTTGDMMLGHALDGAVNNGPAPFGCQSGGQNVGGNLCAIDGQKTIQMLQGGPNTITPPINNNPIENISVGGENLVCWAPSPNPPPIIFPPPCVSPFLGGQEPTSVDSLTAGLANLLVPGDPFGSPAVGIPPSGLLTSEQNAWWYGPSLPQAMVGACTTYMVRQQVGHFLYLVDRARSEVVVLNSNRMNVIDRIGVPDPVSLAMSPNLDVLGVSNPSSNSVAFIDINPESATFHQVVRNTVVGTRPRGIAWQPANEDVLVCNEGSNTLSIISAFSLDVRKVINSQLSEPFEVTITERQATFGYNRNVYFAYIMNRNGNVAIFESGPNTVNGWGYDDVIGVATSRFGNPKAIQADQIDLRSAVWIAHEGPIDPKTDMPSGTGEGAASKLVIESGIAGVLPLNFQSLLIPQFRDLFLGVSVSIGEDQLSGVPVDIAFDNLRSFSGQTTSSTPFSAGVPAPINGKGMVRFLQSQNIWVNNSEPSSMFLAIPNPGSSSGQIDVIAIDGGFNIVDTNPYQPGDQSIPAANVQFLMDYFRQ